MRNPDPLLSYKLASFVCEVGSAFHLSVSRAPADGQMNDKTVGKVRAVRVELSYETEGRGDTDSDDLFEFVMPIDRFGMGSADVQIDVPSNAPISYDGRLIRVKYEIHIRTDVSASIDHATDIPVLVVPVGGATTYHQAHPLPSQGHALG